MQQSRHIPWHRVQANKLRQMIYYPSFPRLPMPAARGVQACNRRRPIMITMIRNEPMESAYFFPKVPSKYVQLSRQIASWLGYLPLTIISFVIWPILYYTVLLIVCPFMMFSRYKDELRRLFFDVADVPKVVLAKYRRIFYQRQREWDYEMGMPVPLPQQRKRDLSQIRSRLDCQTSSSFLARLPIELRLHIYKYVVAEASSHVHIAVHWTKVPGKRIGFSRIHGHQCSNHFHETPVFECRCHFSNETTTVHHAHDKLPLPPHSCGVLALSKTCTQIYRESISLLYSKCIPPSM